MTNQNRQEVPDGTFHKRMTRNVDGIKLGFEWHGGAYIQVCRGESFARPSEVINVWDYATDGPTIPRTSEAMGRKIDRWIEDYGTDNLAHDIKENW